VQARADRERALVDPEARVVVRVLAAGADERVAAGARSRNSEKSSPPMIGSRSAGSSPIAPRTSAAARASLTTGR
jgi:hypothetical protein